VCLRYNYLHLFFHSFIFSGLDPLELAQNIIAFHRTAKHLSSALPLLQYTLHEWNIDTEHLGTQTLGQLCESGSSRWLRTCKDFYGLLIFTLGQTEGEDSSTTIGAVEQYNKHMKKSYAQFFDDLKFHSAAGVHRQLPGLRARSWWRPSLFPQQFKKLFAPILLFSGKSSDVTGSDSSPFHIVRDEAMRADTEGLFSSMNNDLRFSVCNAAKSCNSNMYSFNRLSANDAWNPKTSWDAIILFTGKTRSGPGKWEEKGCEIMPKTCELLKASEREFFQLMNANEDRSEVVE